MPIQRQSRNVSLTPDLARFVDDRVASGRYGTASEVFRAGLRLVEAHPSGAPPPFYPFADAVAPAAPASSQSTAT